VLRYLPGDAAESDRVLDAVPAVLPALVAHSNRRLGLSGSSTEEALASIEECLPEYHRIRALPTVVALRRSTADLAALLDGEPAPWHRRLLTEEPAARPRRTPWTSNRCRTNRWTSRPCRPTCTTGCSRWSPSPTP
jgi:hypothetical protein